jgi:cytosine/adenosine deaminase-related metal-dependent hydrolase
MPASSDAAPVVLRACRLGPAQGGACVDLALRAGRVEAVGAPSLPGTGGLDLGGARLLPGLVNAHDHLDLAPFPPLGRPPYANLYDWTRAAGEEAAGCRDLMTLAVVDRLFLGGLRNLLAGVAAVAHHGPFHRSLARPDFPLRVLERYQFAHSPGLTPALRKLYRSSDRRIPWFVHAGEGTDAGSRAELDALAAANVLRQNTVVVHGLAFGADEAARLHAAHACLVWQPEAALRLYGADADVRTLRAAGVRVGLGSDSAAAGARDALSTLAAARRARLFDDEALLDLATRASGEVARLPVGAVEAGAPADFVAVDDLDAFLSGDRRAVGLMVVAGRALYGTPERLRVLDPRSLPLRVDGAERRLHSAFATRARVLLARHPSLRRAAWAQGLDCGA